MNIADWIGHWAATAPDQTAIVFEGHVTSYAEFDKNINQYGTAIRNRYGVKRGDRIAFLGFNSPKFLFLLFATIRLGAIFVPLNWRLTARELTDLIRDADPIVVLTDTEMAGVGAEIDNCRCPIHLLDDQVDGSIQATNSAASGSAKGGDEPALLIYTSGTTGTPKGALLSHNSIAANARNSQVMHELTSADNSLVSLPFFHVGGLNILTTPSLSVGATVTLHRKFEPQAMLNAMIDDGPTRVAIVSAQMPPIMALPGWANAQFPKIRTVTTGASPVPVEVFSSWHDKNVTVLQVYGATETCPIAICTSTHDEIFDIASTGRAAATCDIKIVNEHGDTISGGQRGEILIRGENVMSGYWQNEIATKEALCNGWYSSGDIGYQNDAGFYYIVDRKKDLIISGGENIYPAEIESMLVEHDAIAEAAVIAKADARWGEVPIAVVRLNHNSSFDHSELLAFLENRLGRYKIPKDTIVVADFPRNSVGKVQKFALHKQLIRR